MKKSTYKKYGGFLGGNVRELLVMGCLRKMFCIKR